MFVLLLLLLLMLLLIFLVLFFCVAAVWCSVLFVQLASACAAPVVCADFPVCCCFLLLLRLLFGSPNVENPTVAALPSKMSRTNLQLMRQL